MSPGGFTSVIISSRPGCRRGCGDRCHKEVRGHRMRATCLPVFRLSCFPGARGIDKMRTFSGSIRTLGRGVGSGICVMYSGRRLSRGDSVGVFSLVSGLSTRLDITGSVRRGGTVLVHHTVTRDMLHSFRTTVDSFACCLSLSSGGTLTC